MNFLRRLFRRKPKTFPAPSVDKLIARRALRLHNRSPRGAAAYERVHAVLGVKRG